MPEFEYTGWPKNGTDLVRHTAAIIRDKIKRVSLKCSQSYENKNYFALSMQLLNILGKQTSNQPSDAPEWAKYQLGQQNETTLQGNASLKFNDFWHM